MRRYEFTQLDVFTDRAFTGNPLAVFPDAVGLTDGEMQLLAREMNLSETTFVLPPTTKGADVRVRIFTPSNELPYAGHPSVGTHWLLASTGRLKVQPPRTRVHQEVLAGVLAVDVDVGEDGKPTRVFSTQREPRFGRKVEDREVLCQSLNLTLDDLHDTDLPAQVVDTGVPWLLVPVRDEKALARVQVQTAEGLALARDAGTTHVYPFCVTGERDPLTKARGFIVGEFEDPVTGSASGCLGAYAVRYGLVKPGEDGVARFTHAQGEAVERPGLVSVEVPVLDAGEPGAPRVGGRCVKVLDGVVELP